MLIDRSNDILVNLIAYFVKNTRSCGKLKLFKLLYNLDLDHFKATGRPVTNLDYFAWPMGPVPVALVEMIDKKDKQLLSKVNVIPESFLDQDFKVQGQSKALKFIPKIQFDENLFSKRQLDLLKKISEIYYDATGSQMTAISHGKNEPWDIVYNQQNKKQSKIPLELVLDGKTTVTVEQADEIKELRITAKSIFG